MIVFERKDKDGKGHYDLSKKDDIKEIMKQMEKYEKAREALAKLTGVNPRSIMF